MAQIYGYISDTVITVKNPYLSVNVGKLNAGKHVLHVNEPLALSVDLPGEVVVDVDPGDGIVSNQFYGSVSEYSTPLVDWFERFHITPKFFEFGNVLTTQLVDIEVFSAFRRDTNSWNTFVNNAGAGVSLVGAPTLPHSMDPLTGVLMQLRIDAIGEPFVDTTLDFGFAADTIYVPISLERIVLFTPKPEIPYEEELRFLTDIIPKKSGKEQRISARKNARQYFKWKNIFEDGIERQRFQNIMYDWQSRSYGIPVWHDLVLLRSAASIDDTVLDVSSTDYTDYRVDGLAVIYESDIKFDVVTVLSIGVNTLTLKDGILNDYSRNIIVAPLRIAVIEGSVSGIRYPTAHGEFSLRFRVKDNDVDLADTSAFSSYDGKILFDDPNGLIGQLPEEFIQEATVIDNDTGVTYENSSWPHNKRITEKVFIAMGRQAQWNTRRAIHAIRGQQVSFYLPTFSSDIILNAGITGGSDIVSIVHSNYAQFVRHRSGRNIIRVNFVDGSTPVIKQIVDSSIISSTVESLTTDSTFSADIDIEDVLRIDFIELVRFYSDSIKFVHKKGDLQVRISAPVITVFD